MQKPYSSFLYPYLFQVEYHLKSYVWNYGIILAFQRALFFLNIFFFSSKSNGGTQNTFKQKLLLCFCLICVLQHA